MHLFFHNLSAYIIAIVVVVAFHEFGHFWVARRLGVKVLRFSIGFGPVLWSRKARDGCEYAVSAIPLGGYVKMLDEREGEVAAAERHLAFNQQSPYKRFAIAAAGPMANFVLAIVFFWAMYVIGAPGLKPILDAPRAESVAASAGIQGGEMVVSLNGRAIATWNTLQMALVEQVIDRKPLVLVLAKSLNDPSTRTVTLPVDKVRTEPKYLFDDLGLDPFRPGGEPVIKDLSPGGSAEQNGFKIGDRIQAHDGVAVASWMEWAHWVRAHPGSISQVTYQRDGVTASQSVLIGTAEENGEKIGRFGASAEIKVSREESALDILSPITAVPAAMTQTWRMAVLTVKTFGRILTGDVSFRNINGPIKTAEAAGAAMTIGLATFLGLLAFISVSIGVINLFPVPVLDGGHLVFNAIEIIKGSPVSEQMMAAGQRVGLSLIVLLMGVAFYNDLSGYFG